jgi:hypothetical protein
MLVNKVLYIIMMPTQVHVEIYLQNKNDKKAKVMYDLEDNDKNILFSNHMFPECLKDFACDDECIRAYSVQMLEERLGLFKKKIVNLPSDIVFKIESAVNFIKRNRTTFVGIRTIF